MVNLQELQFVLSVFGQALAGVANCFAVSVPTMVSQNWFPESERLIATGLLSLSMPLGNTFLSKSIGTS